MQLFRKNWFLTGLLIALWSGFHWSTEMAGLARLDWLKWSVVTTTMFLMAWPLKFGHLRKTVSRPQAPLLASSLNMVLIPLLVWPMVRWMGGDLGGGMMVAAATPCTLASAAVWTRRAGGDDGVAIMVTILTNATCFLVMPFWIFIQTGSTIESGLLTETVYKLFLFVVLPIGVAQLARLNRPSAIWATEQKTLLSTLAMMGLLSMVFIGAINMGLRLSSDAVHGKNAISLTSILIVAFLMGGVHCAVFWGGLGIAKWLRMERAQQIAVAFAGSQKTLMIGLTVAISLEMSIIPIVLYHAIQLVVDTVFADRMRTTQVDPLS